MKESKRKDVWTKLRVWVGFIVALAAIVLFFIYIYHTSVKGCQDKLFDRSVILINEVADTIQVDEGRLEIVQNFKSSENKMLGMGFLVQPKEGYTGIDLAVAHVRIINSDDEILYFDDDVAIQNVVGQTYMPVKLYNPAEDIAGKKIRITITMDEESASKVAFVSSGDAKYEKRFAKVNGEKDDSALVMVQYYDSGSFIMPLFKGFVILFVLMFAGFYILTFLFRVKIETVYLYCVLFLGLLYTLVIIPNGVPDEAMHASTVYRMSNNILRVEETASPTTILKRTDDITNGLHSNINLQQYYKVYTHIFEGAKDESLKEDYLMETGVPMFLYAPAVAGFVVGRLTHMGSVDMYLLSRLLQLIAFGLLSYWALKKTPFGKQILFVTFLLPMTLQQAASLSYDPMVMAVCFLFIGTALQMAFDKEKISKFNMVLTIILSVALIYCKSGAYLPLVLLLFLIPKEKFGTVKKKWLIICGLIVLVGAVFMINSLVMYANQGTTEQSVSVAGYSLEHILTNPAEDIFLLTGNLLYSTSFYISSMIGQSMGFMNISTTYTPIFAYLLLMILAALKVEGEDQLVTVGHKAWMILLLVASVGLIMLSMWVFITPAGSGKVEGVQGRYFLPLLPVLLLLLRGDRLTLKKSMKRTIMFWTVFMHCLEFVYIIAVTLTAVY